MSKGGGAGGDIELTDSDDEEVKKTNKFLQLKMKGAGDTNSTHISKETDEKTPTTGTKSRVVRPLPRTTAKKAIMSNTSGSTRKNTPMN